MLRDVQRPDGTRVGRLRVATPKRTMGIEAPYRKADTSRQHPAHRIYPYLLRGFNIDRPSQGRVMDITCLPMQRGFANLVGLLDWATRRILAWRRSDSLTADFCAEALEEAIIRFGAPGIMNTVQVSQFAGSEFIASLTGRDIRISTGGKDCWRDIVFVERLWSTLKDEDVYPHAYYTVSAASVSLTRYVSFHNIRRPHSALARQAPDATYFDRLPLAATA